MKYLHLILFIFIFICACKKDKDDTIQTHYFSGVSLTDINAIPWSIPDSTDWTLNDFWTNDIADLFSNQYPLGVGSPLTSKLIAYPNPCIGSMNIFVPNTGNSPLFDYVLVDENFNVQLKGQSPAGNLALALNSITLKDTLRLYYKLIDLNHEYRGHGDLILK